MTSGVITLTYHDDGIDVRHEQNAWKRLRRPEVATLVWLITTDRPIAEWPRHLTPTVLSAVSTPISAASAEHRATRQRQLTQYGMFNVLRYEDNRVGAS